jgi:hypothetical protein
LGVLTEELVRLTQIADDGNYLRDELISLNSKKKELQQSVDERDQQIAQLTQAQLNAEKMVFLPSLPPPCFILKR